MACHLENEGQCQYSNKVCICQRNTSTETTHQRVKYTQCGRHLTKTNSKREQEITDKVKALIATIIENFDSQPKRIHKF